MAKYPDTSIDPSFDGVGVEDLAGHLFTNFLGVRRGINCRCCRLLNFNFSPKAVILLPLLPASLTHKNPQRRKIIHGMRPVGRKERSINRSI